MGKGNNPRLFLVELHSVFGCPVCNLPDDFLEEWNRVRKDEDVIRIAEDILCRDFPHFQEFFDQFIEENVEEGGAENASLWDSFVDFEKLVAKPDSESCEEAFQEADFFFFQTFSFSQTFEELDVRNRVEGVGKVHEQTKTRLSLS